VLLFGDSGRLRQGWQPAREKTRLRGFSAANSPARRATPNFLLEEFRKDVATTNGERQSVLPK
jgi:hypothetical protein